MVGPATRPTHIGGWFEIVPLMDGPEPGALLRGELDLAAVRRLTGLLTNGGAVPGRFVLDLSDLEFIDLYGIRTIGDARDQLVAEGGELVVRGPQSAIRRAIELCGFAEWLNGGSDRDRAGQRSP